MSRTALVMPVFALAALVSAACDTKPPLPPDNPPVSRTAGPSHVSLPLPDRAAVVTALLSASDLPPGYQAMPLPTPDTSTVDASAASSCMSAAPAPSAVPVVSAQAGYQVVPLGPFLVQTIEVSSLAHAGRQLLLFDEEFASCASFGSPLGSGIKFTIGNLDVPDVGYECQALRLTATMDQALGVTVFGHVLAMRHLDMVVTVTVLQPFASPEVAATAELARKAMDKVVTRLPRT